MKRFLLIVPELVISMMTARRTNGCPRKRAFKVLSQNVLEYTGAHWKVGNLHLVQGDDVIVISFLGPDGQPSESTTIQRGDPAHDALRRKMTWAEQRRLSLRAA